jgi:hypothetical protein
MDVGLIDYQIPIDFQWKAKMTDGILFLNLAVQEFANIRPRKRELISAYSRMAVDVD